MLKDFFCLNVPYSLKALLLPMVTELFIVLTGL